MPENILTQELMALIAQSEFVPFAMVTPEGLPVVIPKFLIKVEKGFVYLADFLMGETYENLSKNPNVSLSFVDLKSLARYQINGTTEIISEGTEFDVLVEILHEREMHFSTSRIIQGSQEGHKHKNFEMGFPDRMAVIKIKIAEIVCITTDGTPQVTRKKVPH